MKDKLIISDYLPISGKNICSIGNRGHHNFGDELILIGLMKLILGQAKRLNGEKAKKLHVSGGDLIFLKQFHKYFFSEQELKDVEYIQEIPHGIRSGLRLLVFSPFSFFAYFKCDTFVIGGGELFTEETPGSYLYWFWSLLPFWVRKIFFWNTKLYVMGGMQAPKARYNKLILKLIVRNASGCFMRDEESVEVAKKQKSEKAKKLKASTSVIPSEPERFVMGESRDLERQVLSATNSLGSIQGHLTGASKTSIVEWFIDTSYFAITPNSELRTPNSELLTPNLGRHIIINTNPLSKERKKQLSDTVRQYQGDGYTVYFLPAFFTANNAQNDMLCFDALKEQFPDMLLLDRRKRDEFLIIFLSAEKIFCSRLHVFLVAAFLGKNVQAYPYQKKILKNKSILEKCGILT